MKFQIFFLLLGLIVSCVEPPEEGADTYTITVRKQGDWGESSPSLSVKAVKSIEVEKVEAGHCFVLRAKDFAKFSMTVSYPGNRKETCDNSYSSVKKCFKEDNQFLDISLQFAEGSTVGEKIWSHQFVSASERNPEETGKCKKLY